MARLPGRLLAHALAVMLLYHLPQRHQMQRMHHLPPPLALPLQAVVQITY